MKDNNNLRFYLSLGLMLSSMIIALILFFTSFAQMSDEFITGFILLTAFGMYTAGLVLLWVSGKRLWLKIIITVSPFVLLIFMFIIFIIKIILTPGFGAPH